MSNLPIHPSFKGKNKEINDSFYEICEKYSLSESSRATLGKFSSSLTVLHKDEFFSGLLTNINSKIWWNQSTVLMIAAQEGNVDVIHVLFNMGANIHEINAIGNTASMIAAEHGELEVLKLLLRNDADINSKNEYGQTALMLAIERNHIQVAEWLIETDPSQLEKRNKYNKNALIIACEFGKYEITKIILDRMENSFEGDRKSFINTLNSIHTLQKVEGESPVLKPQPIAPVSLVSRFCRLWSPEKQSPPDTKPPKTHGNTPLMFACVGDTADHERIALDLLSLNGIDINAQNQFEDSALSWAALTGRSKVINAILTYPSFQQPDVEQMRKIFQKICSYDFTDLAKYDSLHGFEPQRVIQQKKIADHEKSLQILLSYLKDNYEYNDIISIQESAIKIGLLHGNIRIITIYFMKHSALTHTEPNEYILRDHIFQLEDILNCPIRKLLSLTEQKEMLRRLSLQPNSLRLLVRLAALYSLHFDILKLYIQLLENSTALLDSELPIFYQCLRFSCLDIDDDAVYSEEDLGRLELPNDFLNFPKHLTHIDVVNKLVELSLLLKSESYKRPMERMDLHFHLDIVDNMLLECFKSALFSKKETMQKFIENHSNEISIVRHAHAFLRGPLAVCIRHKISIVFNSGHVNSYVNKLYWGYMRDNTQNHIIKIRLQNPLLRGIHKIMLSLLLTKRIPKRLDNVIECKSNFIFLRFNPSCMYFLEGLAKGTLLSLLVYKIAWSYDVSAVNFTIIVMIISMILYECGELCDNNFFPIPDLRSLGNYVSSIWNILDGIGLGLVCCGFISDHLLLHNGRGYFSVAVIFFSISILNYFGAYEPIGQLLILVFAMMSDLMKFVFVYIVWIFGFTMSLYSLLHVTSTAFHTRTKSFLTLFDTAFLNYNFDETFGEERDHYYRLEISILMVYIVLTAVVLLNLVIARMSATHDRINQKSFEEWQYTRAYTVYSFLLLNERSPFSMLPPPFNLIPTIFSIFDYYLFWRAMHSVDKSQTSSVEPRPQSPSLDALISPLRAQNSVFQFFPMVSTLGLNTIDRTTITLAGTASDWFMGIIVSFIAPILEYFRYIIATLYYEDFFSSGFELLKVTLIFPFIYPFYVTSLIIQTLSVVTRIDLNEKNFAMPICYYESQLPDDLSVESTTDSTIDIKIIRLSEMQDYLHDKHLPIVQIQIQNLVNYSGNCMREGNSKNYIYSKPLIKYPLKQLNLSQDLEMSILILDKDILTGRSEIVGSRVIPSNTVREWIANGRFEGKLELDNGRGALQVVISTCILKRSPYFDPQSCAPSRHISWQSTYNNSLHLLFKRSTAHQRKLKRKEKHLFDQNDIQKIFSVYVPKDGEMSFQAADMTEVTIAGTQSRTEIEVYENEETCD